MSLLELSRASSLSVLQPKAPAKPAPIFESRALRFFLAVSKLLQKDRATVLIAQIVPVSPRSWESQMNKSATIAVAARPWHGANNRDNRYFSG
jgi:hypothetical protein